MHRFDRNWEERNQETPPTDRNREPDVALVPVQHSRCDEDRCEQQRYQRREHGLLACQVRRLPFWPRRWRRCLGVRRTQTPHIARTWPARAAPIASPKCLTATSGRFSNFTGLGADGHQHSLRPVSVSRRFPTALVDFGGDLARGRATQYSSAENHRSSPTCHGYRHLERGQSAPPPPSHRCREYTA